MGQVLLFTGVVRAIPRSEADVATPTSTSGAPAPTLERFGDIPLNAAYRYAPREIRDALHAAVDPKTLLITAGALASLGQDVEGKTLAWLAGLESASVLDVRRFLREGAWHLAQVVDVVKHGGSDVAIEAACRGLEAHLYCVQQMLSEPARSTVRDLLARADASPLRDRAQKVLAAYHAARDAAQTP